MSSEYRPQKCSWCQVTAAARPLHQVVAISLCGRPEAYCLLQVAQAKMRHHSLGTTQP
jgi:hypothetical protein